MRTFYTVLAIVMYFGMAFPLFYLSWSATFAINDSWEPLDYWLAWFSAISFAAGSAMLAVGLLATVNGLMAMAAKKKR